MAEKEKAAVAVETTATNAQEASPASMVNDTTIDLINQFVDGFLSLIRLNQRLREESNGMVDVLINGTTARGVDIIEDVLGDKVKSAFDVTYEDGLVLRHLRFGEWWGDGEIYGRINDGT